MCKLTLGSTQLFRLNKANGFSWAGESDDIILDDIMRFNAARTRADKSKVGEAVDFLFDVLSDEVLPTSEVTKLAGDIGHIKKNTGACQKDCQSQVHEDRRSVDDDFRK